jgi:hypothetical protein
MHNFEHIVCEFAEYSDLTYGKAENNLMRKIEQSALENCIKTEDILNNISSMNVDEVSKCCEKIAKGKLPFLPKARKNQPFKDTTLKEMLIEYNNLRAKVGLTPIKAWKASKAELYININNLAVEYNIMPIVTITDLSQALNIKARIVRSTLRKLKAEGKTPETRLRARWQWDIKFRGTLIALLRENLK